MLLKEIDVEMNGCDEYEASIAFANFLERLTLGYVHIWATAGATVVLTYSFSEVASPQASEASRQCIRSGRRCHPVMRRYPSERLNSQDETCGFSTVHSGSLHLTTNTT